MYKTKFYEILIEAREDNEKLLFVINKIEPLLNKYSKINTYQVDEELKNYLIEHVIKLIKSDDFIEKISK